MNLDNIAEHQAKLVRKTAAGLVSDQLLTRKFEGINPVDVYKLAEILRSRTSLNNKDDGNRYYVVTDPLLNHRVEEGVWRNVSVTVDLTQSGRNGGTIFQVLAKGYAQSLVATEARLVGGPWNSIEPVQTIQRQYVALDKEKLGAILEAAFESDYVTDPVIEGHTYSGNWRITRNDPSRSDDGSGVLTQTIVKGWVKSSDSLPTAILLTDEKTLLSPFVHDTTSETNVYTWEYRGIDPDYAQTLRNTISLTSGVKSAEVVKAGDGSSSIRVTTESRTWSGDLTQKWRYTEEYNGFNAKRIITTYSHIAEANLAGHRSTLETPTTNYKVVSLEDNTSDDGFFNLVQVQQRMFIGSVSAANGTNTQQDFIPIMGATADVITTQWLEVPDADLATAMTTLATPPSGYTVTRVGHNYNGTGSATITRIMIKDGVSDELEIRIEFPSFEGERKTYIYMGLDNADAATLFSSLQTTTETDYKVVSVTKAEGKLGTLSVTQIISRIFNTAVTTDNGVDTGHEFMHLFGSETQVITSIWLEVTDANLDSALTTLATPPSGYTVANIVHNYSGSGSATVTRTIIKQGDSSGIERAIEYPEFQGERKTFIYPGLDNATAETRYSYLQTNPPSGYVVQSVSKTAGRFGTIDVTQVVAVANTAYTTAVRTIDYSRIHGLVELTTTIMMNVKKADIDTQKAAIAADATKNVLNIFDDDAGRGLATITYVWRTKAESPTSLGALSSSQPTPWSEVEDQRHWFDVNISDEDSLKDAVALALAGTAPYSITGNERIIRAVGTDNGDKTGRITQVVQKNYDTQLYIDYSLQRSFNPHGLYEAVQTISVREYPEVKSGALAATFTLLQTFLTGGDSRQRGSIQVSLNAGKGNFSMRGLKEGAPDWDNSTPTWAVAVKTNVDGRAETKESIAPGVPVADAEAAVAAVTASADHVLNNVRFDERGNGEAVLVKREAKADGTAMLTKEGSGNYGHAYKETTWFDIHPDDVAATWATAETYNVAGNFTLDYRIKYRPPGGLTTIINSVRNFTSTRNDTSTIHDPREHTLVDIDRSPCSVDDDVLGYKWRYVTMTISDYRTLTLTQAQDHISGGDKDSFHRKDGRYRWGIVWFARKITRTYGAWSYPTATPEPATP